jgi:hypothetical protein
MHPRLDVAARGSYAGRGAQADTRVETSADAARAAMLGRAMA